MIKNIFYFLSVIVLLSEGLYSCKKDNINGDASSLIEGSYLTLKKNINGNLDFSNQAATVSIAVGNYGSPAQTINIFLAKGAATDTTTWVFIKSVPYSDSVILSVSTADLSRALAPASIQPGNQYILQNQVVTKDGRKFSAYNTPTNYSSFPAYNFALTWKATAVCAFNQAASAGAYKVTYDGDWVDYHTGDAITVLAGPGANEINALIYPATPDGGTHQVNTIIDVDPATGTATIASQNVGYYGSATPGNLVTVSGTGFVFSCTGFITLKIDVIVGGSDYGPQSFSIQHN